MHSLLVMGGYGIYVWPAYAITLAVFSLNLFSVWREKKQVRKLLQQYQSYTRRSHES